MFFIYSLVYSVAILLLLPFEYARKPKRQRHKWIREKFGFLEISRITPDKKVLWVHAVSMGEVIATAPFMREIRRRFPEIRLILSTITHTGMEVADERVSDLADIIYLPFDLGIIFNRVFRRVRPLLFITIETELWPNAFRACRSAGIPVVVMNGRLSEKSFRGYQKISFFMKTVLNFVEIFCMQDQIYAERIRAFGIARDRIRMTGNFKFDTRPSGRLPEWSGFIKGPLILAGSTHEGEEELILSVFKKIRNEFPDVTLIVAPRHPERFARVEELIKKTGHKCIRRSEISQCAVAGSLPMIVILDTVGELSSVYGIADIAVVGGSFVKHGGQNPLEPAFWSKPVVCGPHMENFPFIEDFYKRGGAIKAESEGLADVIAELMRSPEKRKAMGETSRAIYNEKSGSIEKSMAVLSHFINK